MKLFRMKNQPEWNGRGFVKPGLSHIIIFEYYLGRNGVKYMTTPILCVPSDIRRLYSEVKDDIVNKLKTSALVWLRKNQQ